MSKARAKGTRQETRLLAPLRDIFGEQVERAPLRGIQDLCDFVGAPLLIEAKHTQKPLFLKWLRICRTKSKVADKPWALFWKGDARTEDGHPLMLVEEAFGFELLHCWNQQQAMLAAAALSLRSAA